MLGPLLILQLAIGTARPDSVYGSRALAEFIAAAAAANRLPPASLRGYRARVESELALLVRDTLGRERLAQVEQVAMNASWERGQQYDLRVTGYRSETVGVPYSALSFARSWTLPYLYGDRLTLGVDFGEPSEQSQSRGAGKPDTASVGGKRRRSRVDDTLRAVHPLARDRERFYRFSGGDTIAMLRSRDRGIPIVRVRVTQCSTRRRERLGSALLTAKSISMRCGIKSCACADNLWRRPGRVAAAFRSHDCRESSPWRTSNS
jgi:hypothetical protein